MLFEANRSISILKKPQYQKVTGEDLNISIKPVHIPVTVIRDGKVLWDELRDLGFDESWLKQQLLSKNTSNPKDILFAEWLKDNGMFIQTLPKTKYDPRFLWAICFAL